MVEGHGLRGWHESLGVHLGKGYVCALVLDEEQTERRVNYHKPKYAEV